MSLNLALTLLGILVASCQLAVRVQVDRLCSSGNEDWFFFLLNWGAFFIQPIVLALTPTWPLVKSACLLFLAVMLYGLSGDVYLAFLEDTRFCGLHLLKGLGVALAFPEAACLIANVGYVIVWFVRELSPDR